MIVLNAHKFVVFLVGSLRNREKLELATKMTHFQLNEELNNGMYTQRTLICIYSELAAAAIAILWP